MIGDALVPIDALKIRLRRGPYLSGTEMNSLKTDGMCIHKKTLLKEPR